MWFRNRLSFWRRRGIKSLEETTTDAQERSVSGEVPDGGLLDASVSGITGVVVSVPPPSDTSKTQHKPTNRLL